MALWLKTSLPIVFFTELPNADSKCKYPQSQVFSLTSSFNFPGQPYLNQSLSFCPPFTWTSVYFPAPLPYESKCQLTVGKLKRAFERGWEHSCQVGYGFRKTPYVSQAVYHSNPRAEYAKVLLKNHVFEKTNVFLFPLSKLILWWLYTTMKTHRNWRSYRSF